MDRITRLPPLLDESANSSAVDRQEMEITDVVHELKNQVSTLGLGIAALKYPGDSEDERQRHFTTLEDVIGAMGRQFRRLDDWLIEVGYKSKAGEPVDVARGRRTKKPRGRAHQDAAVKIVESHGRPLPFDDNQEA